VGPGGKIKDGALRALANKMFVFHQAYSADERQRKQVGRKAEESFACRALQGEDTAQTKRDARDERLLIPVALKSLEGGEEVFRQSKGAGQTQTTWEGINIAALLTVDYGGGGGGGGGEEGGPFACSGARA